MFKIRAGFLCLIDIHVCQNCILVWTCVPEFKHIFRYDAWLIHVLWYILTYVAVVIL
uniref:Uncharacterized protein n=1 Tax=Arundo donax TaxID=35708 RepID=A0A0A9DSW1_ARUDO